MDGMDDLQFYVLSNSISVTSGQWVGDNERLGTMEPSSNEKILASSRAQNQDH